MLTAFLRRPQKFEKISHLFWHYWVKTAVLSKLKGDFFPILWPSHNVLTLLYGISLTCVYTIFSQLHGNQPNFWVLLGNSSLFLEIVLFISNEIIFQIEIGKTEVLVISLKWSAVELIWGGADAHAVYALFFISNIFIFFVCLYFCGYAWKELIDFNGFCVILKKKNE